MNSRKVLVWALTLVLSVAGAYAVEDGLGTNHVRTLRAYDGIVLDDQKITSWDEVSSSTLTNNSVSTDMIQDGAVTADKIAGAVAGDGLTGGAGTALAVNAGDGLSIVSDEVVVDSSVVRTSGAQTIADVKTFSASPIVPTPTTEYQAATKEYVDGKVSSSLAEGDAAHQTLRWDGSAWTNTGGLTVDASGNVQAGGTMLVTGAQTNLSDLIVGGSLDVTGATTLDEVTVGDITFSGAAASALAMGGFGITGLAAPSDGTDAATKTYVDNAINGLSWKDSVRVASFGNFNLAITLNNVVIDGVTLAVGDRVLLRQQTTTLENGIYVVNAGLATRATDMSTSADLAGAAVFASHGTANAGTAWICTTPDASMGVNAISFAQFAVPGTYEAGDGLSLTAHRFDVVVGDLAGVGLEDDGDNNLRIAAAVAGDGLTGGGGSALAVDTTVVRTSGAQTLADVKTFSASPIVPTPTTEYQAATKEYVDGKVSSSVAGGAAAHQTLRWDGAAWTNAAGLTVDASGNVEATGTLGVSGVTTLADETQSTDKDTGALVVQGGVGIEKNLNVGGEAGIIGNVTIASTTVSSDKDTGALVVQGGVGVASNIHAGGNIGVVGNLQVDGDTTLGNAPASDTLTVNAAATFNGQVIAAPSDTLDITAGGGIADISRAYLKVRGDGGPVDISANPQIAAGVAGQMLTIQGVSDANSLKLDDGTGLALNSGISFTLKNGHIIQLIYDGTVWRELARTVPAP